MVARPMLAWLALLLGLALVAGAIAPQPAHRTAPATTTAIVPSTAAAPAAPSGRPVALSVRRGQSVTGHAGDVITLTVPVTEPDTVAIAGLGLSAFADATDPASLLIVGAPTGRYPITLRSTGETIGTLEIQAASSSPRSVRPAA